MRRLFASALERDGAALIKNALPLRPLLRIGANATDRYLIRRHPDGKDSVLGLGDDLARLIDLVVRGPAGDAARRYFRRVAATSAFIVPERGLGLRCFAPTPEPVKILPFHQDTYAFPRGWRLLTCWILLYPSDLAACARLALIPSAAPDVLPLDPAPTHPTMAWMEADHAAVAGLRAAHGEWRPDVQLGDVVMFNELVLHRTAHEPPIALPRLSVECRLIALNQAVREEYARNGIPYYLVEGGALVRHQG